MIPDFNKMSEANLMEFWHRYHRPSRKDAKGLVGDDRKGYMKIAATFANYASNVATAKSCRRVGDKLGEEIYLHSVRLCWDRIPEDLRGRLNPGKLLTTKEKNS